MTRLVANRLEPFGPSSAVLGLLPDAARLARAADLTTRFHAAGLRRCAVVRSPVDLGGVRTWLALESMQVTGSFKVRGAFMALEALGAEEAIAASAGNHGAGIAFASQALGAKVSVVVPKTAPKNKVAKIEGYGARVIVARGPGYDGAEREAIALAKERGVPFVSPYDDLDVVAGNGSSLGFEIAAAIGRVPDVVVCPLGGGGLATGLACAFAHEASDEGRGRVYGVQTEASPAFALSLERGSAVTEIAAAETLAEGLEGALPERAFARLRAVVAGALVVTEASIAGAMRFAFRDLGLVLEGTAAAALVPLLDGFRLPESSADVVIVLTGRNVDRERLVEVC